MPPEAHPVYEFSGFRLDPRRRQLARLADGEAMAVTPKAFDALVLLVEHAGQVVSRQTLSKALWPATIVEENNLTQAIATLRRVIGEGHIATVPGRGYQFVANVHHATLEPERPTQASTHEPERADETLDARRVNQGSEGARVDEARGAAPVPRSPAIRRAALFAFLVAVLLASALVWFAGRSARERDDPLRRATFKRLTDFDGAEEHAAISRDGRFVAFLSDRDGAWDVWVGQIDSGDFRNLTAGAVRELRNPSVRTLGFTPDGLLVTLWSKTPNPAGVGTVDAGWAVPTIGGSLRPYLPGIAELDWSSDALRIVYHTSDRGDPMFVTGPDDASRRQIYIAPGTEHNHFPLWSRDGRDVYFVRGKPRDEMDVWRISASGGEPERLTFHNSQVSFPTWLDERTLLYLATDRDGSGPWIHELDLQTRSSRRLNSAGVEYASLAVSGDGRRLIATAARSTSTLWQIAVSQASGGETEPMPLAERVTRGASPQVAAGRIVYRAPKPGASVDGIWQLSDGVEMELWRAADGRVVAGPALAPDGRIAFTVQREKMTSLYVMDADGGVPRVVSEELDVRGAPAWSPDGEWLAIGAIRDGEPRLFRLSLNSRAKPVQLGDHYALDPAWAPSGAFLVYSGADIGTNVAVGAVNADGTLRVIPELRFSRGSRRMDFLGSDHALVFLRGNLSSKEFWVVDLASGEQRLLANVGPGPLAGDFDVASDGSTMVFERARNSADIVLIEFPAS